jgi:hypothetical protein
MTTGLFDALDAAAKQAEEERVALRLRARLDRERAGRDAKWAAMSHADILRMRIEESRKDLDMITTACLGVAVPMWIKRMRHWLPREREERAQALVETLAYTQGSAAMVDRDAMLSSKKHNPCEMAGAFNVVAEGLAILAHCPGGIVLASYHLEVKP